MPKVADYTTRIVQIKEELRARTLSELEKGRDLTKLSYDGAGYGYNLKKHRPRIMEWLGKGKDSSDSPELKKLKKLVARVESQ